MPGKNGLLQHPHEIAAVDRTKIMHFVEGLAINHRTAQRRIKEPETLTIKELLAVAAMLRVPEQQLLELIRDES